MCKRGFIGLIETKYLLGGWNQCRRVEVVCALSNASADGGVVIFYLRYKRCRQYEQQGNANDQGYRDSQADRHQRLVTLRSQIPMQNVIRGGDRKKANDMYLIYFQNLLFCGVTTILLGVFPYPPPFLGAWCVWQPLLFLARQNEGQIAISTPDIATNHLRKSYRSRNAFHKIRPNWSCGSEAILRSEGKVFEKGEGPSFHSLIA